MTSSSSPTPPGSSVEGTGGPAARPPFGSDFSTTRVRPATLASRTPQPESFDLPLFATISERMQRGAAEHGDEDMSATWFTSAPPGVAA